MEIILRVVTFVVLLEHVFATCYNISGSRLTSICYDVVDYEYYLPSGYTEAMLEASVSSALSSSEISILPQLCQISLKKMACSQAFLKCATNNVHIYSDVGLTIPLSFQRPCKSVCENVNDQCLGMLPMLGINNNCSAKFDYSGGMIPYLPFQYDSSNESTICNAMPAATSVQSTSEPYIGGADGVCYGIVDDVYVPPANMLSASFVPFQPPYVVQTMIEYQLTSSLSALPPWLSTECHLALKKYFCGSYFLKPETKVLRQVLQYNSMSFLSAYLTSEQLDYSFALPSYPHENICTEYQTQCGEFIASAGISALVPNCSAKSSGILSYPSSNQTITSLMFMNMFDIHFTTAPNMMEASSDSTYETKCPHGFVVPDEPDDPLVSWITGSGCAVGCR